MTVAQVIRPGDKINICSNRQLESENEFHRIYKSQVLDIKENGNLEIAMPMVEGKFVLLSLGTRYELVFYCKGGIYRAIGQIKERYKKENIYMLEIELKSRIQKQQRREYYRYPCILDISYYPITGEEVKIGSGEAIFIHIQKENKKAERVQKGKIVDLSAGGARMLTEKELAGEQCILFELHLKSDNFDKLYYIVGSVINCVHTDRNTDMPFEARTEFWITDNNIREEIVKFIFEEERRSRQRGK